MRSTLPHRLESERLRALRISLAVASIILSRELGLALSGHVVWLDPGMRDALAVAAAWVVAPTAAAWLWPLAPRDADVRAASAVVVHAAVQSALARAVYQPVLSAEGTQASETSAVLIVTFVLGLAGAVALGAAVRTSRLVLAQTRRALTERGR